MDYRVGPIDREIAKMQLLKQGREKREAQDAARQRTGADPAAFDEARKAKRPGDLFAAGFHAEPAASTTAKADPDAPVRDQFREGFGGKVTEHPTVLDQLMAYSERHAAAQQAPEAPAVVTEPSGQAKRAAATEGQPNAPQQPSQQLELPVTSAALFAQLESKVATITTTPVLPTDAQIRRLYRELPGSERAAIAAKVEREDYGVDSYFQRYNVDYAATLISDAIFRRFEDARKLDPAITPAQLLEMMASQP